MRVGGKCFFWIGECGFERYRVCVCGKEVRRVRILFKEIGVDCSVL